RPFGTPTTWPAFVSLLPCGGIAGVGEAAPAFESRAAGLVSAPRLKSRGRKADTGLCRHGFCRAVGCDPSRQLPHQADNPRYAQSGGPSMRGRFTLFSSGESVAEAFDLADVPELSPPPLCALDLSPGGLGDTSWGSASLT